MRDWTGSSCRKTPPRQRARPPLYCCWCPWNRNKRITAFSPNRNPLLHTKPTYPLSVVKKISIPCCVCQESKYKIEALIHTPLVSCLYCTDCMGSICSQPGLWWQLESILCTKRVEAKGCKPTRMRWCFLMGRQQSITSSRCTLEVVPSLPSNYKHRGSVASTVYLFWWMLCWSRWPLNKKFVCLFVE